MSFTISVCGLKLVSSLVSVLQFRYIIKTIKSNLNIKFKDYGNLGNLESRKIVDWIIPEIKNLQGKLLSYLFFKFTVYFIIHLNTLLKSSSFSIRQHRNLHLFKNQIFLKDWSTFYFGLLCNNYFLSNNLICLFRLYIIHKLTVSKKI